MNRLFLDANVLFSAAYGSPALRKLWHLAETGRCELLTSAYALQEATVNLDQPEHLARLRELASKIRVVPETDPSMPCPVSLAPKDVPVLLAAIGSEATHLITGDLRHFGALLGRVIAGVLICTPRDYLAGE